MFKKKFGGFVIGWAQIHQVLSCEQKTKAQTLINWIAMLQTGMCDREGNWCFSLQLPEVAAAAERIKGRKGRGGGGGADR